MMRSVIAEGHEPPAWLTGSREVLSGFNRIQIMNSGGSDDGYPFLLGTTGTEIGFARLTGSICGGEGCMVLSGSIHLTEAVVLNPDPEWQPVTQAGNGRAVRLNIAFLYEGLVKVVPASVCSYRMEQQRGPAYLITDGMHFAQWWAWTPRSAGWYTPDGEPVVVETTLPLVQRQEAIALNVESVPFAVGRRFTAVRSSYPESMISARFGEEISGDEIWTASAWARIVPANEGQPPAPDEVEKTDAMLELEERFRKLTQTPATRAEKAEDRWCGEYESAMQEIGIAERDYRRLRVRMRYRVHIMLMYRLSPEALGEVTSDRFGGRGHTITDSVAWYSRVDMEVTGRSDASPRLEVTEDSLKAAGYEGYVSVSITGWDEIGPVEGEEATAAGNEGAEPVREEVF